MIKMFKEQFTGKYHGTNPPSLMKPGDIGDGLNIRKVSDAGGYWARKGTERRSAQLQAASILSIFEYTHPRNGDEHFLAQTNTELEESSKSAILTFATLFSDMDATEPAFGDTVREHFYIGDDNGAPIVYGGDTPFCEGFVNVPLTTNDAKLDEILEVTDNDATTYATLGTAADSVYYVASAEKATQIILDLETKNTDASVLKVYYWYNAAWVEITNATHGYVDGTISPAGVTHGADGTISWNAIATQDMKVIAGKMAYWYKVTWSLAMEDGVEISKCQVYFPPQRMTNKWDGTYDFPTAVRIYDGTQYQDYTGELANESTALYADLTDIGSGDLLYVKSAEPLCGIGVGITPDYESSVSTDITQVQFWDGDSWEAASDVVDETAQGGAAFAQTGTIWWDGASSSGSKIRTFDWDTSPGYWYRFYLDDAANFSDDTRVWGIQTAVYPKAISNATGCIEFKGRLLLWGDPLYPNRMRFSARDFPDCFCGPDSGYTDQVGNMSAILVAKPFYNELMLWKKDQIYLLEGYDKLTFGTLKVSTTIGVASPKTAYVVETGSATMHRNEPLSIAIWQEVDGIYMLDGRKPRKASAAVDQYFNPQYSECIAAANIRNRQAFVDYVNNEYHFLLSDGELVYNYIRDEWYPKWEREVDLVSGLAVRGYDNRKYTFGGDASGYLWLLEQGTTDDDDTVDTAVAQDFTTKLKTRAIAAGQDKATSQIMTFRKAWIESRTKNGTITAKIHKNLETTGQSLATPSASIDLSSTDYNLVTPGRTGSIENMDVFELEFEGTGATMEIYSVLYQVDPRGELALV